MSGVERLRVGFHRWLLDRLVLRPSRHRLELGIQSEVMLTIPPGVANEAPLLIQSCVHGLPAKSGATDGASSPDLLVIKFPGTAGRAERSTAFPADLAKFVAATKLPKPCALVTETWTWNPPGYGKSPGRSSLTTLPITARRWAEHVVGLRAGQHTRIWLAGNSLGSLAALAASKTLAASRGGIGLWLRNPPELSEVVPRVARRWHADGWLRRVCHSLPESQRATQLAAQCETPAVYLVSELDSLVPPRVQAMVHQSHLGTHQVVLLNNLDHDGIIDADHQEALLAGAEWLWSQTSLG